MHARALTVAISLLATAAIGVALPATSGCSTLDCDGDYAPSTRPIVLDVSVDLHAVVATTNTMNYDFVAVGAEGTVVASGEAGVSVSTVGTADLRAISETENSWWVVGDAGTVAVSGDQGQTWIPVTVPTTANLRAIFRTGSQLIIVGDDVVLVQGADGTWNDMAAPSGSWGQLRGLYHHADRLYAVGLGGVIWSTADPLGEWIAETSGTQADLFGIGGFYWKTKETVAAVGANGTIVVRESGEWKRIENGENLDFIAYDDYLLGADGTLFEIGTNGKLSPIASLPGARAMTSSWRTIVVGDVGSASSVEWLGTDCYGRPFIVDGQAHAASPRWGDAPHDSRAAIAETWARAGLYEHASVASFARFALELLALGAPPRLLRDLQGAIADELRHAHSCFELARRFGGVAVGPGPMPLAANAFERIGDPISTALALFDEACVEESVAACMAAEAAGRCDDPEVRRVLEGIAIDERRHAVAGWAALRWMLDTFGERVREPLRARLARLRPSNPVLAQLVLPLARAMLHPDTLHSVEVVS